MEITGNEFLSGSVGTDNEDPGISRCNLFYHILYMKHWLGLAYHRLSIDFFLQYPGFLYKRHLFCGVLDGDKNSVEIQWLLDVVECSFLYAIYSSVDVAMS